MTQSHDDHRQCAVVVVQSLWRMRGSHTAHAVRGRGRAIAVAHAGASHGACACPALLSSSSHSAGGNGV
eukprot:1158890-Pelagomonas_calceolata.AAC.9